MEGMSAENEVSGYSTELAAIMAEFSRISGIPVTRDNTGCYSFALDSAETRQKISDLGGESLVAALKSSVQLVEKIRNIQQTIKFEKSLLEKDEREQAGINLARTSFRAASAECVIATFYLCGALSLNGRRGYDL